MKKISKQQFFDFMESYAPANLAEDFDNVGLIVDNNKDEISKILFALDCSSDTINEAKKIGADLIFTHHPILFQGIQKIDNKTRDGKLCLELVSNGIALFSAHTNLDSCEKGINSLLFKKLELENQSSIDLTKNVDANPLIGLARAGTLKEKTTLLALVEKTKKALKIQNVRCFGDLESVVKNVAISSGSGGGMLQNAIDSGAEVFISGDIKHSLAQQAKEMGVAIIDAGHFETEVIILIEVINSLQQHFNRLEYSTEFVQYERESATMRFV